jgi:signal transduction histidine kinase/iron only hydrogenase large subunit-like protein
MGAVWTIQERCKRCYSCIRECPAKAIKVERGQAKVIDERCLACGHCVRVCSQQAKAVISGVEQTVKFLQDGGEVVAMVAPSFVASFTDMAPEVFLGALRRVGFTQVVETAYGADLINREYYRLINSHEKGDSADHLPMITSSCPVICELVEKYVPELLPHLAPVVSPMIAMGRAMRKLLGAESKIVFIGPCAAKKVEARNPEVADAVDEVLTFKELHEIWRLFKVDPTTAEASSWDPPQAYLGRLYPVSGGLLRSAGLPYDIMNNEVIVTEGKGRVLRLLDSIQKGEITAKLVDILFCEGCINGPFIDSSLNYFMRKQRIVTYTDSLRTRISYVDWKKSILYNQDVRVDRGFHATPVPSLQPTAADIQKILASINKYSAEDELNCGSCGYETCREYAIAVFQGIAESEMCLPFMIDEQQRTQKELQQSLSELADAQEQLIQREKLASIGQLAAGVAHEVNNPLGSIMLYAHLLLQQLTNDEGKSRDLKFIMEEAKRCQKIVAGLLNFARQGNLYLRPHRIQDIVQKLANVVLHQPLFERVAINTELPDLPEIELDDDQIYQVFLNLAVNAAEAMPQGGTLTISGKHLVERHVITVEFRDSGCGIPPENISKLFVPFFTTKQIGKGTGLGLAIAYGIIKMHKGNIYVKSQPGQGTVFTVELPDKAK